MRSWGQKFAHVLQENRRMRQEGRVRRMLDQGVLRVRQMLGQPLRRAGGGERVMITLHHQCGMVNGGNETDSGGFRASGSDTHYPGW